MTSALLIDALGCTFDERWMPDGQARQLGSSAAVTVVGALDRQGMAL